MLRLLRSSNPFVLIFIIIAACITRVPILLIDPSPMSVSHQEVLSSLPYMGIIMKLLNQKIILYLTSVISILSIGFIIQFILSQNKVSDKSGNLLVWFLILLSAAHYELMVPSPTFIAFVLLSVVLMMIYKTYFELKNHSRLFNIGFIVSCASILYFPFLVIVLILFISLLFIKTFKLNELVIYWLGFMVPMYLLFTILLVTNALVPWLEANQFGFLGYLTWEKGVSSWIELSHISLLISFVIILYGFMVVQTISFKSLVHFRKFHLLCTLVSASCFLSLLFTDRITVNHFALMIIPGGFYTMSAFKEAKKTWIAEAIHLVLLISILVSNIFSCI